MATKRKRQVVAYAGGYMVMYPPKYGTASCHSFALIPLNSSPPYQSKRGTERFDDGCSGVAGAAATGRAHWRVMQS